MHAGSSLALRVSEFNPGYIMQNSTYNTVPVNNEQDTIFNRLKEDIDRLETKTNRHSQINQTTLNALSPLPTVRRIQSLPDTLEENNYPRAGLLVGLAAANFPADLKEMSFAGEEIKNIFTAKNIKEAFKGLKGRPYQHEMSFFRDTILNKLPAKNAWLANADKTLFSTRFGEFLQDKFKLGVDCSDIGETTDKLTGKKIIGFKFTGNAAQKTLARALHRIPVIGLITTSALELPALIKAISKTEGNTLDKGKAFSKQLIKSAGYIGFTTAAISIAGAITFPYSAVLSLAGMAIGSTIGLMASKELNKLVDKV